MSTDLKQVIASLVYQRADGLTPVEIVDGLSQLGIQSSARQVIQVVERNPKLFVEANGRICAPNSGGRRSERMDMKDMIATVLCQTPAGLVPIQLAEQIQTQFGVKTNTREVLQVVARNSRLFTEEDGRIVNRYGTTL